MRERMTAGGRIDETGPDTRRLTIPSQSQNQRPHYEVAQLDDYTGLSRSNFPWQPPASLALSARVSANHLPGTWGFGWWNDPFSADIGLGAAGRRFPAPPNAAWFFYGSSQNYLALNDDHPTAGFLAATFSAPRLPWPLLTLSMPALPLLGLSPTARLVRRIAQRIVRDDAATVNTVPTRMHRYQIVWESDEVRFLVDDNLVFHTSVVPRGPLGAVLWIDNQYMRFPPDGKIRFGTLPHPGGWLEVHDIALYSNWTGSRGQQ